MNTATVEHMPQKELGLTHLFPKHLSAQQRTKVIVLGVLTVGVSALMWFFYSLLLNLGISAATTSTFLFWLLGAFFFFFLMLAFVSIVALLVHLGWISRLILFVAAFTHLIWFRFGWYSVISLVLLVLGFWYYDWQIKQEESLRIRFSVTKSIRYGLSTAIALCLLAISFTFYGHTQSVRHGGASADPVTDLVGNTVNQVLALQISGYDPNETVDDLLFRAMSSQVEAQVKNEAAKQGVNFEDFSLTNPGAILDQLGAEDFQTIIDKLPVEVRAQVGDDPVKLREYLEAQGNALLEAEFVRTRNKLLDDLKVKATGTTPVGDVVKQLVADRINSALGPYKILIPPILALTIFFVLSIFTFLYAIFIKLFAAVIFAVMKSAKLVDVRTVETKVEMATLSE